MLLTVAAVWAALVSFWSRRSRKATTTHSHHRGAMRLRLHSRFIFHFAWGKRSFACAGATCPFGGTTDERRQLLSRRLGQAKHRPREPTTTHCDCLFHKTTPPMTPLKLSLTHNGYSKLPFELLPLRFRLRVSFPPPASRYSANTLMNPHQHNNNNNNNNNATRADALPATTCLQRGRRPDLSGGHFALPMYRLRQ